MAEWLPILGCGGGAATAFTPASISGLVLWFKADVQVYSDLGSTPATNGASVEQWNDQSGNGNNATQTTSGNRPVYATNSINGLPTVGCVTSGSTFMNLGSTISLSTGALTIYAVGSRASSKIWEPVTGNNSTHAAPIVMFSNGGFYFRDDSDGGTSSAGGTPTSAFAVRSRRDGSGNLTGCYTGTAQFSLGTDSTGNVSLSAILARVLNSDYGDASCLFGEICVYNVATASGDDTNMSTYFNSRWGVSLP